MKIKRAHKVLAAFALVAILAMLIFAWWQGAAPPEVEEETLPAPSGRSEAPATDSEGLRQTVRRSGHREPIFVPARRARSRGTPWI